MIRLKQLLSEAAPTNALKISATETGKLDIYEQTSNKHYIYKLEAQKALIWISISITKIDQKNHTITYKHPATGAEINAHVHDKDWYTILANFEHEQDIENMETKDGTNIRLVFVKVIN